MLSKPNLLLLLSLISFRLFAQKPSLTLWYDKPATEWSEALPLGNGFMGTMIFGDPLKEHLQLNEGTLYSGDPKGTFKNISIRKDFPQVNELLKAKKYGEAQAIIAKEWLGGEIINCTSRWVIFGWRLTTKTNPLRSIDAVWTSRLLRHTRSIKWEIQPSKEPILPAIPTTSLW